MASGASSTGSPDEPAATAAGPGGPDGAEDTHRAGTADEDEGTGVWDATSAWEDEDAQPPLPLEPGEADAGGGYPGGYVGGSPADLAWDGVADDQVWDEEAWAEGEWVLGPDGQQSWVGPDGQTYTPEGLGYYGPDGYGTEAPEGYVEEGYDAAYDPTYPPVPIALPGRGRRGRRARRAERREAAALLAPPPAPAEPAPPVAPLPPVVPVPVAPVAPPAPAPVVPVLPAPVVPMPLVPMAAPTRSVQRALTGPDERAVRANGSRDGGPGGPGGRRPNRGPWPELVIITALAVIAAAVILAVTNYNRGGLFGSPSTTTPGRPATSSAPATTTAVTRTSTSRAATTTTLPSASTTLPPTALPVSPNQAWESGLLSSWLAYEKPSGIVSGDVAGLVPAQLKFAETVSTQTYWAVAVFQPSAALQARGSTAAAKALLANFQNTEYAFSWADGKTWTVLGSVPTGDCPGIWMPRTVLAALSLCHLNPPRMPPGT